MMGRMMILKMRRCERLITAWIIWEIGLFCAVIAPKLIVV